MRIEGRNILEKQYIRRRERSNDVTVQYQKEKRISEKDLYDKKKEKMCMGLPMK
jgi:hypothetical protein